MATIQEAIKRLIYLFTSEGEDKVAAALNKVGAAQANVAVQSQSTERATINLDRQFANIERRFNSTLRAQQEYEKVQRQVNAAVMQNPALQARANDTLALAAAHYGQTSRATSLLREGFSGLGAQAIALSAGLGPIGVALAGMGPIGLTAAAGIGLVASAFERAGEMANEFATKAQNIRRILDQAQISGTVFKVLSDQAKKFGMDSDELASFLQQLNVRFYELRLGEGDFLKRVREIDAGIADQMQRATDLVQVLGLLQTAMKRASDSFQQTALFRAAGGRGGPRSMAMFRDFDVSGEIDRRSAELADFERLVRRVADLQNEISRIESKGQARLASIVTEDIKLRELESARIFKEAADELARGGETWDFLSKQFQLLLRGEFSKAWDLHAAAIRKTTVDVRDQVTALTTAESAWSTFFKEVQRFGLIGATARAIAGPTPQQSGRIGVGGADFNDPLRNVPMPAAANVPLPPAGPAATGLTPQAELERLRGIAAAMGGAATAAEQLEIKQKQLAIAAKEAGLSQEQYNKALRALNLESVIALESRRIGLLGELASASDVEAQKQREINLATMQGVKFTEEQIARMKERARLAQEYSQLPNQLAFEREQLGRTDIDAAVAQRLRAANMPIDFNSATAQVIRLNEQLRQTKDIMVDVGVGFGRDFVSALREGASAWDAFRNAAAKALNKIADMLIDIAMRRLMTQAFGSLFGTPTTSYGSGGVGDQGPTLAMLAHSGGIVGQLQPSVYVHPAYFENAPRYHSGGIIGRERPIIAMDDEEVLTRWDPRHRWNGGMPRGGGGSPFNFTDNRVYNVQGSGPEVDRLREELARERIEAPARILRTIRDAQSRRLIQ